MAATAWSFYNSFREYLGNGQFDLDGTGVNFYMALHTSAASTNVVNVALSTQASLANEVANGNVVWTATGGDVDNVKYAVIYQSGGKLVCYSKLTTSQFNLTQNNTLTVTPSSNGVFELT